MRKLFKEPLLHFLVLGAAIFIVHRLVAGAGDERGRIVVTRGDIASLVTGFSRTWQRAPTPEELDGLIRDRVREEVYYREALAMGLEQDDPIIRRRLRQKLEFVTDDLAAVTEPTNVELTEYLQAHPEAFRVEQRLTFSQVYLSPDRHGERLDQDVAQLLAQLRQLGRDADVSSLGDPFLLEHRLEGAPNGDVVKQYGDEFAASLGGSAVGQWYGPVESGYGVHLVFVEERMEGRVPELAEVRDAVAREWANARRQAANEAVFQDMLERYVVTVEKAPSEAGTGVAAAQ